MPESEVVLHSPRLLLCRLAQSHQQFVRELRQDARVMHYLGGPMGDDAVAERFAGDLDHWDKYGYGPFILVDRGHGEFVGMAGLQVFEGEPDLGYLLTPRWWGHGVATESAQASLWYGFTCLRLRLVRALTQVSNRGSQRVLTKAGMRYLHDRVLWGDRQRCYAVTAAEWEWRFAAGAGRG